jgi:hypothetical protein
MFKNIVLNPCFALTTKDLKKGRGSLDLVAAAGRGGCFVVESLEGLAFRIDKTGAVVWDAEPVTLTADGALEAEHDGSKFAEATQFLIEILADGPRSGLEVIAEARERGISKATLRRARVELGVVIDARGPCKKGRSKWSLKN